MFPVYNFYQRYGLLPSPAGSYLFQTFRGQTFFDPGNAVWGVGRKDYYGTEANSWVTYKPWMSGRKDRAGGIKRGSYYLSAATNSALQAIYTSRQTHGNFIIENVEGSGYLQHGTQVAVRNYQGYYLTWGGTTVTASGTSPGANQTFTIVKISNSTYGPIAHGDSFALKTSTNKYLRIPPGGNADTTATTIGSYETMVLERTNNESLD